MLFIFAPSTGCRIGTLLGLEIKDALDDFTEVHVTRQKKGAKLTTELKSIWRGPLSETRERAFLSPFH
jgi:integrase